MHCLFRIIFLPFLIGTVGLSLAKAQVATDNELYAAYCFSVYSEMYRQGKENIEDLPMQQMANTNREMLQDITPQLLRFKSYLAARGLLTGDRSVQTNVGVALAMKRGQSDYVQCSKVSYGCNSSCLQLSNRDITMKCLEQCVRDNPVCASTARCDKADNLPF